MLSIIVHNKHWSVIPTGSIFIGRGSALGNEYSHLPKTKALYKVGSRKEAIEAYLNDLPTNLKKPQFKREVKRLYDTYKSTGSLNMVCYCSPHACHGDVLKDLIENAKGDEEWLK